MSSIQYHYNDIDDLSFESIISVLDWNQSVFWCKFGSKEWKNTWIQCNYNDIEYKLIKQLNYFSIPIVPQLYNKPLNYSI